MSLPGKFLSNRYAQFRILGFHAVFVTILLGPTTDLRAQAIFAQSGGTSRTDGGKVVGITLNSYGQTISSLGFYDSGDGLATSYTLGLWDSSQNLVATAVVTPSSPLIGDFRYANITPITIGTFATPQSFTIGALLPASMADVWLDHALLTLGAGFTGAGTGQYTPSGSLVYPSTVDTGNSYYVVNAGPTVVPEPRALSLLAAALLLLLSRRKIG
jgi:hypothetical protein